MSGRQRRIPSFGSYGRGQTGWLARICAIGVVIVFGAVISAGGGKDGPGSNAHPESASRLQGDRPEALNRNAILEVAEAPAELSEEMPPGPPVVIYSVQSLQRGQIASTPGTEATVYETLDNEPLAYSVFLNFGPTTGSHFPGAMMADNMGLGNGFAPGDEISSYELLVNRSGLDPKPGLADFHVELWDGDPFCVIDTLGSGYSCQPIPGTEADFVENIVGLAYAHSSPAAALQRSAPFLPACHHENTINTSLKRSKHMDGTEFGRARKLDQADPRSADFFRSEGGPPFLRHAMLAGENVYFGHAVLPSWFMPSRNRILRRETDPVTPPAPSTSSANGSRTVVRHPQKPHRSTDFGFPI